MAERDRLRRPGRREALVLVAAVVALVVGLAVAVVRPGDDRADAFVTRSGAELRVDGEPFRFVGFNLYDAAASDTYSCSPTTRLDDDGLDAAMSSIRDSGGTVVRFWAYQTYTAGGTDWSGVDRVLRSARAHDLRVMPVLEDGPGNCSTGESGVPLSRAAGGRWYSEGYRTPLGNATTSYRDYAARIAAHYRDDPTVVAWSLVNEAETDERSADDVSALVGFARDVAGVVHDADPHHLVTLGSQSNGAPGASGADFAAVYGLPGMDLAEAHDWGRYGSDTEAMPGSTSDGGLPSVDECQARNAQIACAFVLARDLDKPLVIGEAGIATDEGMSQAQRAANFRAKTAAAFEAGASGYLVWQLNESDTDGYAVLVGSEDPTFEVLRETADRWASGS